MGTQGSTMKKNAGPILFTNEQVYDALQPSVLAKALAYAFRETFSDYQVPARLNLAGGETGVLVMPCRSNRYTGVKVSTWRSDQGRAPRVVRAHYTLYDAAMGEALLAGEADALTELRTAATSAVATDALAAVDAQVLGIFGTGRLAAEHVRALRRIRSFTKLLISGSKPENAERFAAEMEREHGIQTSAVAADHCAAQADVICTCTTSATPLFDGRLLRPGTHLNVLGAFHPGHREVDSITIQRSFVVADNRAGALAEAGELVIPLREGSIGPDHLRADLNALLSEDIVKRDSGNSITLYRGVGFALEDMVAAECLLSEFDKKRHPASATLSTK